MKTTKPVATSSIESTRSGQIRSAGEAPRAGGAKKPFRAGSEKPPGAIEAAEALRGVSDRQLLSGIGRLSDTERETVLDILVHLIEIDRRRLYLERGYGSLFEFCVKRLKYCESTAGRRIAIARCIRRFSQAYHLLASGRTSFSSIALIAGIITPENADELFAGIEGRSKREIEQLVSRFNPKSAIRDRVRPVYVKTELLVPVRAADRRKASGVPAAGSKDGQRPAAGEKGGEKSTPTGGSGKSPSCSETGKTPVERHTVLEQRFKIEFGADRGFLDKLERVRSLLSTKHHRALEFSELFEILLDEHIERHSPEARARRKQRREQRKAERAVPGTKKAPGPSGQRGRSAEQGEKRGLKPQKGQRGQRKQQRQQKQGRQEGQRRQQRSRYIPRSVRDEVYRRDGGRCAYVSASGRRCRSQFDLQIDHVLPFARGGDNSAGNLRLLCARHNRLEAEREFGHRHMEKFVKEEPGRYRGRSGPVRGGAAAFTSGGVEAFRTGGAGGSVRVDSAAFGSGGADRTG